MNRHVPQKPAGKKPGWTGGAPPPIGFETLRKVCEYSDKIFGHSPDGILVDADGAPGPGVPAVLLANGALYFHINNVGSEGALHNLLGMCKRRWSYMNEWSSVYPLTTSTDFEYVRVVGVTVHDQERPPHTPAEHAQHAAQDFLSEWLKHKSYDFGR